MVGCGEDNKSLKGRFDVLTVGVWFRDKTVFTGNSSGQGRSVLRFRRTRTYCSSVADLGSSVFRDGLLFELLATADLAAPEVGFP